ncbi:MAG: RNA polymerase sigma factor [Acidimicrobiales bacterium]
MEHRTLQVSFDGFVETIEPGLRRALAGHLPIDEVPDALNEAFTYAWEHWHDVQQLENPGGYLFRVAQSRLRRRRPGYLAPDDPERPAHVEPGLVPAMRSLPIQQRSVVWLVHGCGWSYGEVAVALGITASTVGTHLTRGMARLRAELGVDDAR